VATVRPDGRPHLSPVWAVWDRDALWFSAAPRSAKMRNIRAGSTVSVSTEDPENPVVLEGSVEVITDTERLTRFAEVVNTKYRTDYPLEFFTPDHAAVLRVQPVKAVGLRADDFEGSPTRWVFPAG
jgi:PPOX class probable F420-dependent enzyme